MRNINKILIVGGGNIGTYFAAVCASKGYDVNIFTSKPEKYNGVLTVVDGEGNATVKGNIQKATNDIKEAVEGCELIFVIHPAYMFSNDSKMIAPYIKPGTYIASIPGTGGAEFSFKECIEKGAILFGLQRVPAVARLVEYGKTVCVEGKRSNLLSGIYSFI